MPSIFRCNSNQKASRSFEKVFDVIHNYRKLKQLKKCRYLRKVKRLRQKKELKRELELER